MRQLRYICDDTTMHKKFLGLRTCIYQVPDLPAAVQWYEKAFGTAPYFNEPFYAGFNIGGFELGLHPAEGRQLNPGNTVTAYWGVNDVQAAYDMLISLGAKAHEKPNEVGGGIVELGYTVDEGVISISTDEDLSKNVLTRVYDIRDLIIEVTRSGLTVPGYGFILHNRGSLFTLDPKSPNVIAPNKRPFNTLSAGFVMRNNRPVMTVTGFMRHPPAPRSGRRPTRPRLRRVRVADQDGLGDGRPLDGLPDLYLGGRRLGRDWRPTLRANRSTGAGHSDSTTTRRRLSMTSSTRSSIATQPTAMR